MLWCLLHRHQLIVQESCADYLQGFLVDEQKLTVVLTTIMTTYLITSTFVIQVVHILLPGLPCPGMRKVADL